MQQLQTEKEQAALQKEQTAFHEQQQKALAAADSFGNIVGGSEDVDTMMTMDLLDSTLATKELGGSVEDNGYDLGV